jgi:hypothetical protein
MERRDLRKQPTQTTLKGVEIPIPNEVMIQLRLAQGAACRRSHATELNRLSGHTASGLRKSTVKRS